MITLKINDSEAVAMLRRLDFALTDQSELMNLLGELLVPSMQDRMKAGQQADGTPFCPTRTIYPGALCKTGPEFWQSAEPVWRHARDYLPRSRF